MTTLLWDVRHAMEDKEAKDLEGIIQKYSYKESYYILKHSQWTNTDCDVMKTTYMIRSSKPPKMFNTVLWKVDNKAGTIERVWDLPADIMVPGEFLDVHNEHAFVGESVKEIESAISASGRLI